MNFDLSWNSGTAGLREKLIVNHGVRQGLTDCRHEHTWGMIAGERKTISESITYMSHAEQWWQRSGLISWHRSQYLIAAFQCKDQVIRTHRILFRSPVFPPSSLWHWSPIACLLPPLDREPGHPNVEAHSFSQSTFCASFLCPLPQLAI